MYGVIESYANESLRRRRRSQGSDPLKNPALIALTPLMRAVLKKKGYPKGSTVKQTALNFGKHILKVEAHYEAKDGLNMLDPVTITTLVTAILTYFKKLKEKKDAGGQLTETEQQIVKTGEEIGDTAKGLGKDAGEEKLGELLTSPLGLIVIGAALYFILK